MTIKEKINLLQVQIDSIQTLLCEVEEQMDLFVKEFDKQREYITALENKAAEENVAELLIEEVVEEVVEEKVIEVVSIPDKEPRERVDLRKTFSLNDHYLFKRELFNEDQALMNKVIDSLSILPAYEDCLTYINNEMNWWDKDSPIVLDFIKRLEKSYS